MSEAADLTAARLLALEVRMAQLEAEVARLRQQGIDDEDDFEIRMRPKS